MSDILAEIVHQALAERYESLTLFEDRLSEAEGELYEAQKNVARFKKLVEQAEDEINDLERAIDE